jgi:hypothetical protein
VERTAADQAAGVMRNLRGAAHAAKRKVNLRRKATHNAGNAFARSAGVRPAQRAVAGVEKQIRQLAFADDGHVAGGGRAQARPVAGLAGIARSWEELLHTAHNGLAAHAVQVAVIAVELCGARNAQAVAAGASQAREH